MNTRESTSSEVKGFEPSDDPRVVELVKDYEAEWEQGRQPARSRFLARHPDLAPVITACFDGIDLLYQEMIVITSSYRLPPNSETGLVSGSKIGEFEIVREIGRGGMGVVYEAAQPSLNRRVAIKVLPRSLAGDRIRLQRFEIESRAAAAVVHPHIVPIYTVGEDCGVNFYVMRLVSGSSLDSLIATLRKPQHASEPSKQQSTDSTRGGLTTPSGKELFYLSRRNRPAYHQAVGQLGATVARALDHAHQNGVIHRDIKPANLLLGEDGHIWVTDFGLAQFVEAATVTGFGTAGGTLRYMSPEQASGDRRRLDHRTDIYSLAATLYELSAGQPAFMADEPAVLLKQIAQATPIAPRTVDPTIPIDLETVLLKGLEKDPYDRYATAAEFADDLNRFLTQLPILARRPSVWDRAGKWAGRHPMILISVILFLVILASTSAVIATLAQRAYQAEHDRADEAEQRMIQSKKLGDLIIRISEEEGPSNASLYGPRRLLLLATLENYRQLSESGHKDPQFRAEMDKMKNRIEVLLNKEKEARESWRVCLLWFHSVRNELKLTPSQAEQVTRSCMSRGLEPGTKDDGLWTIRDDPALREKLRFFLADQLTRQELLLTLTSPQRKRLGELFLQRNGPRAFSDPDVVELLSLTLAQRQQIRQIQPPASRLDLPFFTPNESLPDGVERIENILSILTAEQQRLWHELIGKPFHIQ